MTSRKFSTGRDRSTFTGGYDFATRRMEREAMDEAAVATWLWSHHDTPNDERGQFWQGVRCALTERLTVLRGEEEAA
jgi:hypothetical protein